MSEAERRNARPSRTPAENTPEKMARAYLGAVAPRSGPAPRDSRWLTIKLFYKHVLVTSAAPMTPGSKSTSCR